MKHLFWSDSLPEWRDIGRLLDAAADLPCDPIPRVLEEAVRALVIYHIACRQGDWPEAARALSALEVYRLMRVRI